MIIVTVDFSAASQQEIEVFFSLPNVASAFDTLGHSDAPSVIKLCCRTPKSNEEPRYGAEQ